MQRSCFVIRVKPEKMEEYKERHAAVWPEMLQALTDCGWRNYSLFLRADGLLVGYFESEDLEASRKAMATKEINKLWQADMAPYFDHLEGPFAEEAKLPIEQVFYLP